MPEKKAITCSACGRRFAWKPHLAGHTVNCKCGAAIQVPAEDERGGLDLDALKLPAILGGAILFLVIATVWAVKAGIFTPRTAPPAAPLPGLDSLVVSQINEGSAHEARDWVKAGDTRGVLGYNWTHDLTRKYIDLWYSRGAKTVYAFGDGFWTSMFAIEVPDAPDQRLSSGPAVPAGCKSEVHHHQFHPPAIGAWELALGARRRSLTFGASGLSSGPLLQGEAVAEIRPFAAIRYNSRLRDRLSDLIAPPYDVLDDAGKAVLQQRHANNIVTVDLPHLPPKTVGPDSAYQAAQRTLNHWLADGVLARDGKPALYPYAQTYTHAGRTYNRRGFFALVKLSPFGQGQVVPHEKTYPEAITDRLKLTRATGVQLSPVFGLFSDAEARVTARLFEHLGKPEMSGRLNDVNNDLWTVNDAGTIAEVTRLMADKPIYIADGHHRYTMALQYQKEQGALPPDHPANYALFVLVAMQDPGLLILPTHRVIGGLPPFSADLLRQRLGANAELTGLPGGAEAVPKFTDHVLPSRPRGTFGLYDGKTKKLYELRVTHPDVLGTLEPNQSAAWRSLDVAVLQRYLLDEVIAPGGTATKAYTAYASAVAGMTDGVIRQIALLLRPTPLSALEELGRHNEVMPQKSTYFFPKLATGLVLNSISSSGKVETLSSML
jgi:uncharacterized protein (DUF1015 family)